MIDIISCATFNPVYPVIATCSGQRKFVIPSDSEDEEDMEEDVIIDNTLKAWRVPGDYEWFYYEYPPAQEETITETVDVSMDDTVEVANLTTATVVEIETMVPPPPQTE